MAWKKPTSGWTNWSSGRATFACTSLSRARIAAREARTDDGLQLLRPHDGAQAAAGREAAVVVADAGHQGELLAGRADAGRRWPSCRARSLSFFSVVDGVQAPEVGGVVQLDLVIVDEEVDGLVRDAAEQDAVPAGVLEPGAEVAAAVGVAPAAGLGRLGDDLVAAAEEGCAAERGRA